jgi:hypothetical protein
MEAESLAQGETPQPAVLLDGVALDHLRLDRKVIGRAVQRVEDEPAMVLGNDRRRPDRIEGAEIGLRDELEDGPPIRAGQMRRR